MNKDDFATFGGSLTANVISFDRNAIPEPDTLTICMTRGERRIADEIRKQFGGFKRVIIDVDGEKHEYDADSLIRLLEGYESCGQVPELGERENGGERESCESNYERLFGTPEMAARTLAGIACDDGDCEGCSLYGAHCTYDGTAQLEWLRGVEA